MGIPIARATAAKALFDFLYLRPWKSSRRLASYNLAEDLRLNLDDFSENDQVEFAAFVEISNSKKMDQILKNLRKTVMATLNPVDAKCPVTKRPVTAQ